MSSPIDESYVIQCYNKLTEEFQTNMECNCYTPTQCTCTLPGCTFKKSKLKMDPEVMLKSSKLLAEVQKSHRKRISRQYLPKYVSKYLSNEFLTDRTNPIILNFELKNMPKTEVEPQTLFV